MTTDARLALPAISGWLAVGIVVGIPSLLAPIALALWVAAAATTVLAFRMLRVRSILATVAVACAVAALIMSSAAVLNATRNPAPLVAAESGGRYVSLTVVLDADTRTPVERRATPVTIGTARIGGVALEGLSIPALVMGPIPRAGIGSRLQISGTLAGADPGERSRFVIFPRGSPSVTATPPWYLDWANGLRKSFREAAAQLLGDGGALLPGLSTGDTSAVPPTLDLAMKATSLSHLTAVSGANCAVIVGLIMVLGGAIGASRRIRIGVSLLVLAAFVVLVTPGASVLRAAVMAALVLGALASGRPSRGIPVLSLAIIVLLANDPWMSRDYGFVLSVAATASLLVLAGPLARILGRWIPTPLAAVIAIPLAAQLACQPVLILLNPSIPIYGVAANLLAEPAAPIATVLGLIGCVLLPLVPPVGNVVVALAWVPSAWIAAVARFFASAPGAQAPWLPGMLGAVLVVVVTVLLLLVLFRPHSRSSRIVAGALSLALAAYLGTLIGSAVGRQKAIPGDWQIAACDIGQGDAVLVRSRGQVALIDTGPNPLLLTKCLAELGIVHIQLLVLTHYDLDHVGGTAAVFGRVDRAIVGPVSDPKDTRLRTSLSNSGAEVDEVARGESGPLGDFHWSILWPPTRLGTLEPGNPSSVTVRFDGVGECAGGCISSLFLGDLGNESQCRMLAVAHPQPVDVVKVAHHGSADQCETLYDHIRARVGVISVGAGNSYGHPTDVLLGILSRAGTLITRTDVEGMVLLSPAPNGGVAVWTQHPPSRDVSGH